jgi:hypothetical protein
MNPPPPQLRRTMSSFVFFVRQKSKQLKGFRTCSAEKESKQNEKDSQQKPINNPSSAKKPRSTKASAHIIQELCCIAAFQAQLFIPIYES